ncbi:MAG: hypothetical protein Q8N57_00760 [bacterium]|nr:hypothetical protein [bacterium]
MELKGLTGKTSLSKLKEKLGYENYHLKNQRDNILKIVRTSRSYDQQLETTRAMSKMKSLDKEMTAVEARRVKNVFQQLGSEPKGTAPEETSLQKAIMVNKAKRAAKMAEIKKARPSVARINRDLDYLNVDTGKDHGTGLAIGSASVNNHYNVAANRGETSDKGLGAKDVHRPVGHQVGSI